VATITAPKAEAPPFSLSRFLEVALLGYRECRLNVQRRIQQLK
jgi:hypothetical protein